MTPWACLQQLGGFPRNGGVISPYLLSPLVHHGYEDHDRAAQEGLRGFTYAGEPPSTSLEPRSHERATVPGLASRHTARPMRGSHPSYTGGLRGLPPYAGVSPQPAPPG